MALLGTLLDALRRDVQAAQSASPAVGDDARGLRASHLRLLSLTPPAGLRVTDLAERLGMTKQALGEFATGLQERGLLESVRDPADGRVRILRPTARGLAAVTQGNAVVGQVEAHRREAFGPQEWDQLRALLVRAAAGPAATPDVLGWDAADAARTTEEHP